MSRNHIITDDPEIVTQEIDESSDYTDGEGDKQAELESVTFEPPNGDVVTFDRGSALIDGQGQPVGTISRILYSKTAHITETDRHSSSWYHTVQLDYPDGNEGGVPLGELAQQWADGTLRLADDSESSQ